MMSHRRWQGFMLLLVFLLQNSSGTCVGASRIPSSENSPSEFAKIVQSKQTSHARVCGGGDHQVLGSMANTGTEVILTIPNEQLEHIAEFPEEAELWVATNVARFLPATRITHIVAGNDVMAKYPENAYLLVPAMINLHSVLVAARLDGRVKVSTALSGAALAPPARPAAVTQHLLRFLKETGSRLFLKSRTSEATDTMVDAAYSAMRALGLPSGIPVIAVAAAGLEELGGGETVYHSYLYGRPGERGRRRSLATGTFCVALQKADQVALLAGLNWACGQGHADCSAIQPGGACYKQNNVAALASYAYNDYYQKAASTGATCSFNGTASTTASDPSSGSCVFAGSTMAGGGSNSSVPTASPPTGITPPAGFTPPFGSSPPTDFGPPAAGTTPPTDFSPPAGGFGSPPSGFGSPPLAFGPPGSFNGSGTFGGSPSSMLNPYNGGCRGVVSPARLSAVVLAVLLLSVDLM